MSKYTNHVRLTLDGHTWPERIAMRWAPPAQEDTAPATASHQLAEDAVGEAVGVLARAEAVFFALLDVIGPGEHTLVCTTYSEDGLRVGNFHLFTDDSERASCEETEALGFWATIASGFVPGGKGAVIVRTTAPDTVDSVRAWTVDAARRWLMPCTAEEVRAGYQQARREGEHDPEPDLIYRHAESLPVEQSL
ncbi:hypothetical protein [Streptomyces xylophagus]|uniref:hypothetical protein n=1 Tax=Streptomyces xylophagus TaxID=285514 RepID=UPI0005BE7844|nr:hypothetical protein [Streptomyces xylophagus]